MKSRFPSWPRVVVLIPMLLCSAATAQHSRPGYRPPVRVHTIRPVSPRPPVFKPPVVKPPVVKPPRSNPRIRVPWCPVCGRLHLGSCGTRGRVLPAVKYRKSVDPKNR